MYVPMWSQSDFKRNLCFVFPGVFCVFMEILTVLVGLFRIALIATVIKPCKQKRVICCLVWLKNWRKEPSGKDGSRCSKDVIGKLSLYIVWMNFPQCWLSLQANALCHGTWPCHMVTAPGPDKCLLSWQISEFLSCRAGLVWGMEHWLIRSVKCHSWVLMICHTYQNHMAWWKGMIPKGKSGCYHQKKQK